MILSESQPDVYAHLHDMNVTSDHYLLDWFLTLFTRKLPLRLCTRVWDLYFIAGELFLHKTAVALMKVSDDGVRCLFVLVGKCLTVRVRICTVAHESAVGL